ncbi:hypothetical protein OROGR_013280 [Orobanche gracilis]
MGRGRGKGKKQSANAREDNASGEDERLPLKRRGRPQKPMRDEIEDDDDVVEKLEEDDEEEEVYGDGDDAKSPKTNKNIKNEAATENGKKRKMPLQMKESEDLVKEGNGLGSKTNGNVLIKNVGYRPNGSRRKNKPRRAAEVGVECK